MASRGVKRVDTVIPGAGGGAGRGTGSNGYMLRYVSVVTAASLSETVVYPFDLTKTRLQLQKCPSSLLHPLHTPVPQGSQPYKGMVATFLGVAREEGFMKLWRGFPAAISRHIIYSGARHQTYERLRNKMGRNADGSVSYWKSVLCGFCAGGIGQFLASPTDLVKIHMQAAGLNSTKNSISGSASSFHALVGLVREGGVFALWRGWLPNCQRAAIVNVAEFVTYDKSKRALMKHGRQGDTFSTHFIASCLTGLAATSISCPADVIKSRIMNQPFDQHGKPTMYKGVLDCLVKTVRGEGVLALWKGYFPVLARLGPFYVLFWVTNEHIRKLIGVPSF